MKFEFLKEAGFVPSVTGDRLTLERDGILLKAIIREDQADIDDHVEIQAETSIRPFGTYRTVNHIFIDDIGVVDFVIRQHKKSWNRYLESLKVKE